MGISRRRGPSRFTISERPAESAPYRNFHCQGLKSPTPPRLALVVVLLQFLVHRKSIQAKYGARYAIPVVQHAPQHIKEKLTSTISSIERSDQNMHSSRLYAPHLLASARSDAYKLRGKWGVSEPSNSVWASTG